MPTVMSSWYSRYFLLAYDRKFVKQNKTKNKMKNNNHMKNLFSFAEEVVCSVPTGKNYQEGNFLKNKTLKYDLGKEEHFLS